MGGSGRAFDVTRFFVVCLNSLGSPYGTASPVTAKDGDPEKERYGPEFPLTTIRDDVRYVLRAYVDLRGALIDVSRLHKLILDDLGVRQVAAAIGGSLGGMLVLEYAYFGTDYVRTVVAIATSSRHSAWGISWGEAQRQSIYCDPKYEDGYYSFQDPPTSGLGAARMSALLTYRSRNSFESRFGRNTLDTTRKQSINGHSRPSTPSDDHWAIHNDGHRNAAGRREQTPSSTGSNDQTAILAAASDPQFHAAGKTDPQHSIRDTLTRRGSSTYFSAQSYLRYQGEKFVKRFDSNCYIAMSRKLDTHDVSRHRVPADTPNPVSVALSQIKQPTLVLGIESDGLFTFAEQQEIAAGIPDSRLKTIDSPEGHDAFLLQFEQVNRHILEFFREVLSEIMDSPGLDDAFSSSVAVDGVGQITKTSTFGEAEVEDMTAW